MLLLDNWFYLWLGGDEVDSPEKTCGEIILGPGQGHPDQLCRVVEGPVELDVGRVGLHLAQHVDQLPLRDAVDHWLFALADRHVYTKTRQLNQFFKI